MKGRIGETARSAGGNAPGAWKTPKGLLFLYHNGHTSNARPPQAASLQPQEPLLERTGEREHAVLAAQVDDDVTLVETHHRALAERLVAHGIADLDGIELLARRTGERRGGSFFRGLGRRLTSLLDVPTPPRLNVLD